MVLHFQIVPWTLDICHQGIMLSMNMLVLFSLSHTGNLSSIQTLPSNIAKLFGQRCVKIDSPDPGTFSSLYKETSVVGCDAQSFGAIIYLLYIHPQREDSTIRSAGLSASSIGWGTGTRNTCNIQPKPSY